MADDPIIAAPDRLAMLEAAVLNGEPLGDVCQRLAILQAIDVVAVGAAHAEQAARRQREADEILAQVMREAAGGGRQS